ncbi:MAG: hypothetical protein J6T25_03145 [Bacilli bacterium]|nr:hypothetical protein [Bacilli bacterium]
MGRLFKAFIFKIRRDVTFKITLIVGAGIAVFITLLYLILQNALPDEFADTKLLTGPTMLLNSFSPVQNFGIAIPVNLISFTCLEFTQGTIRNKIIAGNSKFKIYASLCLSGLIFAFALIIVYAAICTGLGSIFGGFDLSQPIALMTGQKAYIDGIFILKYLLIVVVVYISVVSFAIFMATSFRNIGPCIPIVMITLMVCYLSVTIIASISNDPRVDVSGVKAVLKIINPLYALSGGMEIDSAAKAYIPNGTLIAAIINNLVYAGLFFTAGSLLFKKRDVK